MLWWGGVNPSFLKDFHVPGAVVMLKALNTSMKNVLLRLWVTALPLSAKRFGEGSAQLQVNSEEGYGHEKRIYSCVQSSWEKNQSSSKDLQPRGLLCPSRVTWGVALTPRWTTSLQEICGSWQHRVKCCAPYLCFRNIHLSQVTNTHLSFSVLYQLSEITLKRNLPLLLTHSPPSLLLSPHSPLLFAQTAVPNLLLLLSVAKSTFNFFFFFFSACLISTQPQHWCSVTTVLSCWLSPCWQPRDSWQMYGWWMFSPLCKDDGIKVQTNRVIDGKSRAALIRPGPHSVMYGKASCRQFVSEKWGSLCRERDTRKRREKKPQKNKKEKKRRENKVIIIREGNT